MKSPPPRDAEFVPLNWEQLNFKQRLNHELASKVASGLVKFLPEMKASGEFRSDLNDELLIERVFAVFEEYHDRKSLPQPQEEQDRRFKAVSYLLLLSGVAQPLSLGNWKVDRVKGAEKALGIKSFESLERVQAEKYAHPKKFPRQEKCRHFHKGAGNGVLMQVLGSGEDVIFAGTDHERKRSDHWEEVGMGDKLYFTIDGLIRRNFLRKDVQLRPDQEEVLKVLFELLQRALRRTWEKKNKVDLNDILEFLAHPDRPWLYEGGEYKTSEEFEEDLSKSVSAKAHQWFIDYRQQSTDAVAQSSYNALQRRGSGLKLLRKYIAARKQNEEITGAEDLYLELMGIQMPASLDDALHDVKAESAAVKGQISSIQRANGPGPIRAESRPMQSAESRVKIAADKLRELFDERFVAAMEEHVESNGTDHRDTSRYINLNAEGPDMYLHNFVPGDFKQIPELFPEQSFMLVTSVRSDSHVVTAESQQDVENTLKLLEPGGVYLSDGIRESFNRIIRAREILAAVQKDPELRAEAVMDSKTGELISVMVQRAHPEGYLTDDDKKRFLQEGAYTMPLDEALQLRPALRIVDHTRRRIMKCGGVNREEDFKFYHPSIDYKLRGLLLRYVSGEIARENPELYYHNIAEATRDRLWDIVRQDIFQTENIANCSIERIRQVDPITIQDRTRKLLLMFLQHPRCPLGNIREPTEKPFSLPEQHGFYDVRKALVEHFGAKDRDGHTGIVRAQYGRALYYVLSGRIFDQKFSSAQPRTQDTPLNKEERKIFREYILELAQNVDNSAEPIIDDKAAVTIIRKLGQNLREAAVKEDDGHPMQKLTLLDVEPDMEQALTKPASAEGVA